MPKSFEVKVTQHKNKFRVTIPASELRAIDAKTDDYIKAVIQKNNSCHQYYLRVPSMPKSRTNLQFRRAVPKTFIDKAKIQASDRIKLNISLIKSIRSSSLITEGCIDLLAAIPNESKTGKSIMIDVFYKNNEEWLRLWYCSGHGGSVKSLELKRFIRINRLLGELFGLMQAESSKKGIKFDFTIKFLSQIKLFMAVSALLGISKSSWHYTLFYQPNLRDSDFRKYVGLFATELSINENEILCVENKNLLDVVYSINISHTLLAQIMISLLTELRRYIAEQTTLTGQLREFAAGFIIKYLLGDGCVISLSNSGIDIFISEGNLSIHEEIKKILNLFNIHASFQGIKIHLSTNFDSMMWLLNNGAFLGHKNNRYKLLKYVLSNYYYILLYARLKSVESTSTKEFARKYVISSSTAQKYLNDNTKRGFFDKTKTKNSVEFKLNQKGKDFINLIDSVKVEYLTLNNS